MVLIMNDWNLDEYDEEKEQFELEEKALEATILVLKNRYTRQQAWDTAVSNFTLRQEVEQTQNVIHEKNGKIVYLEKELEFPSSEGIDVKQLFAVKEEILKKFES